MRKVIFLLVFILILFPFSVDALSGSVSISCNNTVLDINTSTTCTLRGYTNEEVSALSMTLNASGNVNISSVSTSDIWQGNGAGGDIDLYTDANKSGDFAIATFVVQSGAVEGRGVINVGDVKFFDINFTENSVVVSSLEITVKKNDVPKEENKNQNEQKNNITVQDSSNVGTNVIKKSNDATLKSLVISNTTINFDSNIFDYDIEVSKDIDNIQIEAIANDIKSQVIVPTDLILKLGKNDFSIKVIAEDGSEKNYNLHIIRLDKVFSNNSKLKKLEIAGYKIDFNSDVYEYDLGDIKDSSLRINAIVDDNLSKVEIYGANDIGKKDVILIKVIAEDDSFSDYVIYVNNVGKVNVGFIIVYSLFFVSLIFNILLIFYLKKNKLIFNKLG